MGTKRNPLAQWLSYPWTWLVVLLIAGAHTLFSLWFRPGMILQFIALGGDGVALVLWFIIAFKSGDFQSRLNRQPYEETRKSVVRTVKACPQAFRDPAVECMDLTEKIRTDFHSPEYEGELAQISLNISRLAEDHLKLYKRFRDYGTPEQKENMKSILNRQVESIRTTLKTLKTFSGNLTLLDASTSDAGESPDELKFINKGLQEVIKEFENE